MDERAKLKHVEIPEAVVFWRWVSVTKLAFVTTTSVYQLNLQNPNEQQVKVMDRYENIST